VASSESARINPGHRKSADEPGNYSQKCSKRKTGQARVSTGATRNLPVPASPDDIDARLRELEAEIMPPAPRPKAKPKAQVSLRTLRIAGFILAIAIAALLYQIPFFGRP
jgi:hypothetical protein